MNEYLDKIYLSLHHRNVSEIAEGQNVSRVKLWTFIRLLETLDLIE
jgi:hypothetical protein